MSKAPKASREIVFAEANPHGVAGIGSGFIRGQQNGAANRVAAKQGSLRAAQDLHVGDIAKFHGCTHRAAHVDIVDVHAHTRINRRRRICLSDAANEHLRRGVVAGQRSIRMELEIRRHLVEIGGADDLLPLECVGTQRRDRDRRVLQVFGAAPCGDDDSVDGFRFCLGGSLSGGACAPAVPP